MHTFFTKVLGNVQDNGTQWDTMDFFLRKYAVQNKKVIIMDFFLRKYAVQKLLLAGLFEQRIFSVRFHRPYIGWISMKTKQKLGTTRHQTLPQRVSRPFPPKC